MSEHVRPTETFPYPTDLTIGESPSMQRFRGKVVIVTGSGFDAGRAAATLFAREGASVLANDTKTEAAESVAEEIKRLGGLAISHTGDVSTEDGAEGVVARAVESFGGLDILLNVRLMSCDLPLATTAIEDFDHVIRHTLKATFMPTRFAGVQFRQQRRGGRIITITSNAGLGHRHGVGMAAASEGVIGMTRTVARDLGRYGVTCNAIAMSSTSTTGLESAAALVGSLCLDISSHVNGIVFGVDGGELWTYSNPSVTRSFHKWGIFSMDEMDDLIPRLFE